MLKIASIDFPRGYEVCEGHEWKISMHVVDSSGITEGRRDVCRSCGLEILRIDLDN